MSDCAALEAREERFCRDYVRRPVGTSAAEFAGYDPDDLAEAAYRLLARADIQDRIAALRHELVWRQCHDSDAMLAKLQAVYELALEKEQYYAAVRAVTLQARIAVLVDDRGRGTQRRRERAVTWAWDGKPTAPEATETARMPMNGNQCEGFAGSAEAPPSPCPLPQGGEGSKEECGVGSPRALSTPGGGKGWGEAGAPLMPVNANECQSYAGLSGDQAVRRRLRIGRMP